MTVREHFDHEVEDPTSYECNKDQIGHFTVKDFTENWKEMFGIEFENFKDGC